MRASLLALVGLVISSLLARAETPEGLKLFLLIGQSNMAGRGKVEPQDQETNPRIFMLTKELQWELAKDPLHYDKPSVAGVGLGSEFARVMAKAEPQAKIGLIPAAFGGTSMAQWKPGGALYNDAVKRARAAMKNGTLTGILWHQGEADSSPEKVAAYPTAFAEMIARLRKDLNAAEVPVVIGELGHFRPKDNSKAFNAALPQVAAGVPHCASATAEGLNHHGDGTHFDAASLRTFGQRYAEAFLRLQKSRVK